MSKPAKKLFPSTVKKADKKKAQILEMPLPPVSGEEAFDAEIDAARTAQSKAEADLTMVDSKGDVTRLKK